MNIDNLTLPKTNSLVKDYVEGKENAMQFFGLSPYDLDSYRERLTYLQSRDLPHRELLVEGLRAYNRQIGNRPEALEQIERLRFRDTYVVVAGQQAGLFTGPLYTIHKAVHVIQTAHHLEKELGISVVPVFWIAGEDHDTDEIDHVHTLADDGRIEKIRLKIKKQGKASASMLTIEVDEMLRVVERFFTLQTETVHTSKLRQLLVDTAMSSKTLVDWFAKLMVQFFGKHGLILLESSASFVRELEKPVFQQVIEKNQQITAILLDAERRLQMSGYQTQLSLEESSAHFFLYENGERLLMERSETGFQSKDKRCTYSRQQLLDELARRPEKFSANVVTRPLMQEHLLPTLAFIGGSGELAYWAYFKEYFASMGYQLPICLPRTSMTLLELSIARKLELFDLSIETVLNDFPAWKQKWQASLDDQQFAQEFEHAKTAIADIYQPIANRVVEYDAGLKQLVEKNIAKLMEQITFLQRRTEKSILEKHEVSVRRIERIERNLIPNGVLQERVFCIFQYANKYGLEVVDRLVNEPFSLDSVHKVVNLSG